VPHWVELVPSPQLVPEIVHPQQKPLLQLPVFPPTGHSAFSLAAVLSPHEPLQVGAAHGFVLVQVEQLEVPPLPQ
jgi:hypothetical protein